MIKIFDKLQENYRKFLKEEGAFMAKLELNAVYDEDMIPFLRSIEMLDPIQNGEVECSICSKEINIENILTIYPENGEIKMCCDEWSCYHTLMNKGA